MSRIGKKPVPIPTGVEVKIDGPEVTVKGPKGTLTRKFHPQIGLSLDGGQVNVTRASDHPYYRSLHGMTRAVINNMIIGVTKGYGKELEMVGIGFRGEMKKKSLMLHIGYSHPILVTPPEGVNIEFDAKAASIKISGIDKELVGLTADKIRSLRKPEPYQGKGIRYKGEHIRRKAGKTAA